MEITRALMKMKITRKASKGYNDMHLITQHEDINDDEKLKKLFTVRGLTNEVTTLLRFSRRIIATRIS